MWMYGSLIIGNWLHQELITYLTELFFFVPRSLFPLNGHFPFQVNAARRKGAHHVMLGRAAYQKYV